MSEPERINPSDAVEQLRRMAVDRPAHSVLSGTEDDEAAAAMRGHHRDGWAQAIPARFQHAKVGDFEGDVREDLAAWSAWDTDESARPNLVLTGPVGTGKTHGAVAACRALFAAGLAVMFMPVGELLDHIDWRRPDSHEWLERYCTVPLLIVDDLGAERGNEWTGERLYLILNRRWLDGLPTVVTTNLTLGDQGDLQQQIGERTYSRLAHGAIALNLTGKDRRRG